MVINRRLNQMKIKVLIINLLLILIIILSGCDRNRYYEKNYDMVGEAWHRDSVLIFEVPITDTVNPFHIVFNSRITGQYEFCNMYLFITTVMPNDTQRVDTLECFLADAKGKWLGKGFGSVWSNKIYFKRNIVFPYKGTYTFFIEQAMRTDELPHVLDAGLRIEKAL
jgi:gliding motility-associated lipoprotein GldH